MGAITIIGTGWLAGQLTMEAAELLRSGAKVLLHTDRCGCAVWLKEQGIAYESLDALYERCEDFDEHAEAAARAVLAASEAGDILYCVADVRDRSVPRLLAAAGERARVIAGPPSEGPLLGYVQGEIRAVEASDWEAFHATPRENCLVREMESRELACEVKLKLMAAYPEETEIWLLNGGEAPEKMKLYELDRARRYDHRTCALVPAVREVTALERYDFEHLNEIMRRLCGPGGCPWDRAQTHESLRTCMLEEAYEVIDAIDEGDMDHLYDELGDVLLQVAIHAELARLHGEFDIGDVTTAICEKMISRHTHVFGADSADDADQVLDLWSRNKMNERGQKTHVEAMKAVTRALPSLLRAVKVLKRSAEAGMQDEDASALARRCAGRLEALPSPANAEAWLGEVLMGVCGVARLFKVDPEIALNGAVNRLIERFGKIEAEIAENGDNIEALSLDTLRKYWDLVKLC